MLLLVKIVSLINFVYQQQLLAIFRPLPLMLLLLYFFIFYPYSAFGVVRFAGIGAVQPIHDILSFLGGTVGYPLLMLAYVIGPGGLIKNDIGTATKRTFTAIKGGNPFDKLTLAIAGALTAGAVACHKFLSPEHQVIYTFAVAVPISTAALYVSTSNFPTGPNWSLIANPPPHQLSRTRIGMVLQVLVCSWVLDLSV